jgi:DNA relaxase NicK
MILDWLSFTLPVEKTDNEQIARDRMLVAIYDAEEEFAFWLFQQDKKPMYARRPYAIARQWGNVAAFAGVNIDHTLIEVSGQGCEELRRANMLDRVLSAKKAHFTRIDIAIDIPDITPDEIIEDGYSDAFRTHSRIASDTGVTHYVGSMKSERYARVYRYNEPHPRSSLCRIEMVHRKRYAKIIHDAIQKKGLLDAGMSALAAYKFKHAGLPQHKTELLDTIAIIKGDQKTIYWLLAQVAPAFRRLVVAGSIPEPERFFREHFLPKA